MKFKEIPPNKNINTKKTVKPDTITEVNENNLEKFEVGIEKVEDRELEIIEKGEDHIRNTKGGSFAMSGLLDRLKIKSRNFFIKLSKEIAKYPNEFGNRVRDRRIDKKAQRLYKYMSNNYSNLYNYAFNLDEFYTNKLKPFLVEAKKDTWGKSKLGSEAFRKVDKLINYYCAIPQYKFMDIETHDFTESLLDCLKTESQANRNYVVDSNYRSNNFENIISCTKRYISSKRYLKDGISEESLESVFNNDPFILSTYHSDRRLENRDEFAKRQVYNIAENHPPQFLPHEVTDAFYQTTLNFPEEILNDADKRSYFFEVIKNYNSRSYNQILYNFTLTKEQQSLSDKEVRKVMDDIGSYDIHTLKSNIYLSSLTLSDDNLKHYFELTDRERYEKDKNYNYTPKEFLSRKEAISNEYSFVLFVHHKKFNLNIDERLNLFDRIINQSFNHASTLSFENFLAVLMDKYSEVSEGIPKEIFNEKLKKFIGNGVVHDYRVNSSQIHHIFSILDQYSVFSEEEKKVIFKEVLSNISDSPLSNLLRSQQMVQGSKVDLNIHEKWILNRDDTKETLEEIFYKRGTAQDVRHLFYQVIDGSKEVADKDRLIRLYSEKINYIENEEFINLFVIKKNQNTNYISLTEYLPLFASKLRIADVDEIFNQINELLRLNQITKEEYNEFHSSLASYAPFQIATKAMETCINDRKEDGQFIKKQADLFLQNVISQFSAKSKSTEMNQRSIVYQFNNIIERAGFENLKPYFLKELLTKSLENENTQKILVSFFEDSSVFDLNIKTAFPDEGNLDKFLDEVLRTKNIQFSRSILNNLLPPGNSLNYLSQLLANKLKDSEVREKFLNHSMSLNNLDIYYSFLMNTDNLSREEYIQLVSYIEARGSLSKDSSWNDSAETEFFDVLLLKMVRNPEIFKDKAATIFKAYVLNNEVSNSTLENISTRSDYLFVRYQNFLKDYLAYCNERKGLETFKILTHLYKNRDINLPEQESKKLFMTHISNNVFDESSYKFYTESIQTDNIFNIDKEQFDKNIELFGDNDKLDKDKAIKFLKEQRQHRDTPGILFCNPEQEKFIIVNIIENIGVDVSILEKLNEFDAELFKSVMKEKLQSSPDSSKSLPYRTLSGILNHDKFILYGLEKEVIDCVMDDLRLKSDETERLFEGLCKSLGNDNFNPYIKERVSNLSDERLRSKFKTVMLRHDMLNPQELGGIYQEVKSGNDIRGQVLSVAEILGSLASQKNKTSLIEFLSQEERSEQCKEKLEIINQFTNKYSLQEKGRTITTMLFAREYLPDRSLGEVIQKVGSQIEKYENILNRFSNNNIPENAKVSIGMEYEVTKSTANGYEELTGHNFKEDIIRLSEAAHIGNGNDAIHEIATRPTVNPYLLLLEAQLLHDLEYVDYNFQRNPDYTKGARGYHLTLGGERGFTVGGNIRFIQNAILGASWGGIQAGDTGGRVSGGRGVTVRGRNATDNNNIKIFEKPTNSVELRSLSIDKLESFQRAVLASYYGGVAIQVLEGNMNSYGKQPEKLFQIFKEVDGQKDKVIERFKQIKQEEKESRELTNTEAEIIYAYTELVKDIKEAVDYHNKEFLIGETDGYFDKKTYVDVGEFGGEDNKKKVRVSC